MANFRNDIGGARRLYIDICDVCPTIMAVGIGSVNTSQYRLYSTKKQNMTTKPKYEVPSMDAIRKTTPNGYCVMSTFAGCGGSSTGYRMAGYKVLWANEFIPAAIDT